VKGERTLFVATGTVDGVVDFSGIAPSAVTMSPDRRTVRLQLPHAALGTVRVDPAGSYVYEHQRGVLNRLGDVFSGNPSGEREFYQLAETKMLAAAQGSDGIVARSETNTTSMLTALLRSLGFTAINIDYGEPTAAGSASGS
jgi:hypothetical protein